MLSSNFLLHTFDFIIIKTLHTCNLWENHNAQTIKTKVNLNYLKLEPTLKFEDDDKWVPLL